MRRFYPDVRILDGKPSLLIHSRHAYSRPDEEQAAAYMKDQMDAVGGKYEYVGQIESGNRKNAYYIDAEFIGSVSIYMCCVEDNQRYNANRLKQEWLKVDHSIFNRIYSEVYQSEPPVEPENLIVDAYPDNFAPAFESTLKWLKLKPKSFYTLKANQAYLNQPDVAVIKVDEHPEEFNRRFRYQPYAIYSNSEKVLRWIKWINAFVKVNRLYGLMQ